MMKIVAIGNRLMKDDGIAIAVAENLKNKLEDLGFEVIIGETDFQLCFHLLNADDFVIILDAAFIDGNPGNVHVYKLQEASVKYGEPASEHEMSIFDMIKIFSKPLKGYFISIEAAETGFGFELSDELMSKFSDICLKIECIINRIMEAQNA
ncbi:hydrogenase maturation protease [Phosphitispora sp. TUW77]|uniref:hydrogenase maturation protease n=1 Tax=Phosphitispora sp. TUW77 TaxID=3152361 RepID=UPI003AB8ACB2